MMRVATTLLTPEEVGRVSLVLTTVAFFAMFLINPVGMFINRRLHAWQARGVARRYLICYVNYLLLVALIAAMAMPLFSKFGLINFGIPIGWLILLVSGSLLLNTINQTAIPSLNMLGFSGKFVLLSIITVAASLFCATSLILIVRPSAQYWLLGLLTGQALLGVIGTKILFAQLQVPVTIQNSPLMQKVRLQSLFNFAWPVAIAAGLAWTQGQGYRYIMEGQLGLAQLGLFVAGYGISAGMIAGFESVLTTYFQPRLYRDVSINNPAGQAKAWKNYATAVIPSLILTVVFISMLAPELTRVFLGKDFQSAADYVIWGALVEAGRVLVGVYSLIAHVHMRTRLLILPNLVGATLAITLCALLIPSFGAVGVGIGLVLSGLVVVLVMHFFLIRHVNGGVPIVLLLKAVISAMALWGITLVFRNLVDMSGWDKIVGVLMLVSTIYLGLQYLFLRQHLTEKMRT